MQMHSRIPPPRDEETVLAMVEEGPESYVKLIREAHAQCGHGQIHAAMAILRRKYSWINMTRDIDETPYNQSRSNRMSYRQKVLFIASALIPLDPFPHPKGDVDI